MRFTSRAKVPVPAAELFRWHERPGAFQRLTPPWQPVALESLDGIRPGDRAVIRLGVGPAGIDWVAEHRGYDDACLHGEHACSFEDVQLSGPFGSWHHVHRMRPDGGAAVLEDDITYSLPLAPFSGVAKGFAAGEIERLFAYRHRVTHEDLRRHADAAAPPMTVAITGASGTVGSALAAFLQGGGHTVVRMVRSRDAARSRGPQDEAVYWNVEAGEVDTAGLARLAPDAVVHLAGEPITRLDGSAATRRRIWESRTKGTLLLSHAIASLPTKPRVLVSASASGLYGDRGAEWLPEDAPPGEGFLPDLCRAWEAATAPAEAAGIRTVHARIGLVTTPAGGPLKILAPVTALGLGGWPGDGRAYWPWIALDDAVYAIHHAILDDGLSGGVNLAAPEPATTRRFVETLAAVQNRPAVLRVPAGLIRAVGGELARRVALASARMRPAALERSGFRFATPDLAVALAHLLGRLDAHTLPPSR